jgi:hypothetical protein
MRLFAAGPPHAAVAPAPRVPGPARRARPGPAPGGPFSRALRRPPREIWPRPRVVRPARARRPVFPAPRRLARHAARVRPTRALARRPAAARPAVPPGGPAPRPCARRAPPPARPCAARSAPRLGRPPCARAAPPARRRGCARAPSAPTPQGGANLCERFLRDRRALTHNTPRNSGPGGHRKKTSAMCKFALFGGVCFHA